METIKFCPICGDVLVKVEHTTSSGYTYYQWECPENDWFEPEFSATEETV